VLQIDWSDGSTAHITIDGATLECGMFGPAPGIAPTIVLLHEGLGALSLWRSFPQKLSDRTGMGVFAWSRLGYGQSDLAPMPRPLDYMSIEGERCLPEVLDAFGFQDGAIFGHSDGATIAAIFAGAHHDLRVRALILMAPHFFTEPGGQTAIAVTRDAYLNGPLRERLSKYHRDVDATFLGWADAWLDPAFSGVWSVEAGLSNITVPTLAIQGAQDEYGTLAHIEALAAQSPSPVETAIIENCRHSPHQEKPEETLAAVSNFLSRTLR
jgi:pimeloyl-ACP methyl ester carboxylesterase